jgi:hypothetical protein
MTRNNIPPLPMQSHTRGSMLFLQIAHFKRYAMLHDV